MGRLYIIGLLGGVASGKSLVAKQLEQLGAGRLDGDRAGHQVLEEGDVKEALQKRWGEAVFDERGEVERKAVGQIVFAPTPEGRRELEFLEGLTHPRIGRRLHEQAAELAAIGKKVAVLDAPVMLKAGWNQFCDKIIYVDAPREIRLARALQRGWSRQQFERREAAQEPLEQKRAAADLVIDNSGSPRATRDQLEQFWNTTFQSTAG